MTTARTFRPAVLRFTKQVWSGERSGAGGCESAGALFIMETKDYQIGLLAAGNLALEAVCKWLPPLVQLGQIGVAAVTIAYILRKLHLMKKSKKDGGDEV